MKIVKRLHFDLKIVYVCIFVFASGNVPRIQTSDIRQTLRYAQSEFWTFEIFIQTASHCTVKFGISFYYYYLSVLNFEYSIVMPFIYFNGLCDCLWFMVNVLSHCLALNKNSVLSMYVLSNNNNNNLILQWHLSKKQSPLGESENYPCLTFNISAPINVTADWMFCV